MNTTINVLEVLDEMDAFRRKHRNDVPETPDWCMRCLEAILANHAGFHGRTSWTDLLLENPDSMYNKGLETHDLQFNG